MIVGLLQLGAFLGTAWCIGHLFEVACARNDRPGPPPAPPGADLPVPPPAPPAGAPRVLDADVAPVVPPRPAPALVVPVGAGPEPVVRLFRTPLGAPTAVAFTTAERLHRVLGADQAWLHLAEPALRSMVGPLGVAQVVVDPTLVAPASTPSTVPSRDVPSSAVPAAPPTAVPTAAPTAAPTAPVAVPGVLA